MENKEGFGSRPKRKFLYFNIERLLNMSFKLIKLFNRYSVYIIRQFLFDFFPFFYQCITARISCGRSAKLFARQPSSGG